MCRCYVACLRCSVCVRARARVYLDETPDSGVEFSTSSIFLTYTSIRTSHQWRRVRSPNACTRKKHEETRHGIFPLSSTELHPSERWIGSGCFIAAVRKCSAANYIHDAQRREFITRRLIRHITQTMVQTLKHPLSTRFENRRPLHHRQ